MKKTVKSIVALFSLMLFVSFSTQAQWAFSGLNIYNTTGGTTLNTNGKVGIGTSTPEDKLQVGAGLTKIVMGSAGGQNIGYGSAYIGFNASRQNAATWSTSTDGAHNGGGIIYSNVIGDMLFSNIPNAGTGTTNQAGILDATILNNTRLCIRNYGNIGIGTTDPYEKLQVDRGNVLIRGTNNFANISDEARLNLGDNHHFIGIKRGTGISINTYTGLTGQQPESLGIFLQENTANVGIGTDLVSNNYNGTPNYFKLSVNGVIRGKGLIINTNWADFVFEQNYKLKPLKEVEQYINQNGHLPEIPSATDIEKNGGNVGELLKLQMQKIEELTLYIIQQQKEIEQNKAEIQKIKAKLDK